MRFCPWMLPKWCIFLSESWRHIKLYLSHYWLCFNFDHLVKVVAAWTIHYKVTIFPFAINKYLWKDALRLCKYLVSRQIFHSLVLAYINDLWLKQLLLWWLLNDGFLIPSLLLHLLVGMRGSVFFTYLPIYHLSSYITYLTFIYCISIDVWILILFYW